MTNMSRWIPLLFCAMGCNAGSIRPAVFDTDVPSFEAEGIDDEDLSQLFGDTGSPAVDSGVDTGIPTLPGPDTGAPGTPTPTIPPVGGSGGSGGASTGGSGSASDSGGSGL